MKIRSLRYRKRGLTPADLDLDKDHIVGTAFSLGEDEILDDECVGEEHTKKHAATSNGDNSIMDLFIIKKDN